MTKQITVEASTTSSARKKALADCPPSWEILSERVLAAGKQASLNAQGKTVEEAVEQAQRNVPAAAYVTSTQTIRDAGKRTLTVETFDEQTAEELVKGQIARHEKMDDLQLLTRGSKGFLGIGKKPDIYQAIISFDAHVKLTYKEKTRIIFTVGPNLIKAVQSGDLQKVQEAFKDGARLEESNESGYTPLMLAALYSDEPIVEFLLSKGANVNAATKWGATALTRAAQEGKIKIVELLLSNGVDVNQSEYDGYTALSRAAMNGHYEIVEMLLAKGANLGIKTKHGHTALTLALENRHARIADLLQDTN